MRATLILFAGLLAWPVAAAESRAVLAARQAAGLFVQSCVHHAGTPAALRAWAEKLGLPELPAPGRAGFLKDAAGVVYDASNPAGKYVVISHDDGGCLVMAEAVDTAELTPAIEAALREAAYSVVLAGYNAELEDARLRHRTYHAAQGARALTLVVSHGPAEVDQAMLSAAPR